MATRNDNRTRATDAYGKPGITNPSNHPDFIQVVVDRTGFTGGPKKAYLTPHERYQDALLTAQQNSPGDGNNQNVIETYETMPGFPLDTKSTDTFGAPEITRTTDVVPDTDFASTSATVEGVTTVTTRQLQAESATKAKLTEIIQQVGSIVYDIEKADPGVPNSRATVERYLVLESSAIPDDTAQVTYERKEVSGRPLLRMEIKTTYEIPPDFIESRDGTRPMPTLLSGAVYFSAFSFMATNKRPAFPADVIYKITHQFSTTRTPPVVDSIIESEWQLPDGFSGSALVAASEADRTYVFTKGSDTLTWILDASTPTLEDYVSSWIGELKITGGGSEIWRAKIYRNTKIECVMQ